MAISAQLLFDLEAGHQYDSVVGHQLFLSFKVFQA